MDGRRRRKTPQKKKHKRRRKTPMNKPGQSRDQKKRFLLSLACRYGHLGDGRAEVLEMEKVSQAALPREGYPQRLREGKP